MQYLGAFHSLGALWLKVLNELETKGVETVYSFCMGHTHA